MDKKPVLPRMLLTNARSLSNKIDDLELVIDSNKVEVAVVTETWFNDASIYISNIPKYTTLSKSRTKKRGGGVAIFVKDNLSAHMLQHNCDFECMWVKIRIRNQKSDCPTFNLYVGAIYYPPSLTKDREMVEHLCHTVDDIRATDGSAVVTILGDFNHLDCSSLERDLDMTQMVSFPTRHNSTLDKLFTNFPFLFKDPERLSPLGNSDHCCILFHSVCELPQQQKRTKTFRPLRDSSVRSFGQWIVDQDWCNVLVTENSCSTSADNFITAIDDAYKHHFPLISSTLPVK